MSSTIAILLAAWLVSNAAFELLGGRGQGAPGTIW
jgi:hypothetical protein